MPIKRKKPDLSKTLMNAGLAFGGGLAAEVVSDLIAKNGGDMVA